MTEKQDKFIDYYCRTGNATQSAIEAGYSEKTANQKGYELKKLLKEQIYENVQIILQDRIPASLYLLSELAQSAESESVRLGAVKDLLDRSGLKPVERIETTSVERMSTADIQRELDGLRKQRH